MYLACGFGDILAIWGGTYNVLWIGNDMREHNRDSARKRVKELDLNNKHI